MPKYITDCKINTDDYPSNICFNTHLYIKYTQNLSPELKDAVKDRMTEQDVDDLIAFLNTLTDHEFILNPKFDKPE